MEQNRERARDLVEQVYAELASIRGPAEELAELHASLANTFRDLEDPRAGDMIAMAIDIERSLAEPPILSLGCHELFYADWLLRQGRWAEAKRLAIRSIETHTRAPGAEEIMVQIAQGIVRDAREHEPD